MDVSEVETNRSNFELIAKDRRFCCFGNLIKFLGPSNKLVLLVFFLIIIIVYQKQYANRLKNLFINNNKQNMSILSVQQQIRESDFSSIALGQQQEDQVISMSKIKKNKEISEKIPAGKQKVSRFIENNHISLQKFWKSKRNHASYGDIKDFCESLGLKLTSQDQIEFKNTIFLYNATVSINQFCDLIDCWKIDKDRRLIQFLKNRSQKVFEGTKQKIQNNSFHQKKVRPSSSMASLKNKNVRPQSSSNYCTNKSKQYLVKQKQKQKQIEGKLELAIKKAKNQYEYQLLLKMGQANDLNKEMESVVTYRAYKNAQGNLKVRVFNLDKFQKQINLEEFQRQFNNIKKRYNQTKKISVWQVLSGGKKNQEQYQNTISKKNVKKSQRQKQLINILTQTMNLTNILKDQLKILKSQGIYRKN